MSLNPLLRFIATPTSNKAATVASAIITYRGLSHEGAGDSVFRNRERSPRRYGRWSFRWIGSEDSRSSRSNSSGCSKPCCSTVDWSMPVWEMLAVAGTGIGTVAVAICDPQLSSGILARAMYGVRRQHG